MTDQDYYEEPYDLLAKEQERQEVRAEGLFNDPAMFLEFLTEIGQDDEWPNNLHKILTRVHFHEDSDLKELQTEFWKYCVKGEMR